MENKDAEKILTLINQDSPIAANIEQSYIFTTEDKIRILYDEYNRIKKLSSDALSWLGIFIALLISDITCDFKSFWIFDSYFIRALFAVATALFCFLFLRSLLCWLKNREKLQFSFFINKLRGEENKTMQSSQ